MGGRGPLMRESGGESVVAWELGIGNWEDLGLNLGDIVRPTYQIPIK